MSAIKVRVLHNHPIRRRLLGGVALGLALASVLIGRQFHQDLERARLRAAHGSTMLQTRCGAIEYQEAGSGVPLLMVHGAGGGHDQGMAFSRSLTQQGIRVIAVSRFGYLRTPLPADATPAAQADAHICVLDALGIEEAAVLGLSAGAPSALQLAIRHPERVNALVLVVPMTYKPATVEESSAPPSALGEKVLNALIGSDFVYWAALHVARDQLIRRVLATPPEQVATANAEEQAQVAAILNDILPVSARAEGLRNEAIIAKDLPRYALESIRAPALIISARDDGYGTYASAEYTASQIAGAKFVGFEQGGHALIGHGEAVRQEIAKLLSVGSM
jgi:2-hydroxy-6-oxonona-2,4-dienedioate hydrolase